MIRRDALQVKVRELREAAELSQGRVDDEVVEEALRITSQVDRRLAFGGDATVVALAGATGSGKSSTFNVLTNSTLAVTSVRRPTTSSAMAAMFTEKSDPAMEDLLDWLDIPTRHQLVGSDPNLSGMVLLDLPDHDSTEIKHRTEVDRLVKLVDVLVWVVDPQKYADNALHERYLVPLAANADVMLVVLNQADRLEPSERQAALRDLRALLDREGLEKAGLHAISAATGEGLDQLKKALARVVRDKKAAAQRLEHDIVRARAWLSQATGTGRVPVVDPKTVKRLSSELAEAAGALTVTSAVEKAWKRRGSLATGWPVLSWVSRLRPDPLRRLHLDKIPQLGKVGELAPVREQRTSLPAMGGVSKARVDNAVRTLADEASTGLPRGWQETIKAAARSDEAHLPDELDRAVGRTDLGMDSGNGWWWIIRILQWLLMVAMVVGLGWLTINWGFWYFKLPEPIRPIHVQIGRGEISLPSLLSIGGAAVGVLLWALSKIFVDWGARVKARSARRAIERSIVETTNKWIVGPVNEELARYAKVRQLLD